MYEHGRAINMAVHLELDDVVDPADTRRWITTMLESAPVAAPRQGKKRPNIDTW
jgi:acetyl-CoA carboxylase carboxyltransferase component